MVFLASTPRIFSSPVLPRAAAESIAARDVQTFLDNNPWTEPPADVVGLGMAYAAKYLKDLEDYGRTLSNRLKVVLVGLANAGKTSIAIRLERHAERLPTPDERTVGVEIRDIQLGPAQGSEESGVNADLDVKLWDFAGQKAYYDTHQVGAFVHDWREGMLFESHEGGLLVARCQRSKQCLSIFGPSFPLNP